MRIEGSRETRHWAGAETEMAIDQKSLNLTSVKEAYKRWAPVYDWTFGVVAGSRAPQNG